MYAEERRQAIADRARREGRVEVAELATSFMVTTETIRRDLTDLERRGVLRRVHGGAIPLERLRSEPDVAARAGRQAEEKRRIAKRALEEVPDEGVVLIDAGTTTGALAAELPTDRPLTVVTNALPIALMLSPRDNLSVLLLGGRVRSRTLATVDDWTQRQLAELNPDVAFIAANGISVARGLTTPDPAEAAVKRAMVAAGRRVVLVADHTKVGIDHFVRFAELDDIDRFVTDTGLPTDARAALEGAGLEVVVA